MSEHLISPEAFFGFQPGTDRKIARWNQIIDYFQILDQHSQRLKLIEMGPSTEGNPFLLAIISSPSNLDRLEHLRELNASISDPVARSSQTSVVRSEGEMADLVSQGKAIICQSMGLHASEIGSTQMAPELAYHLLTKTDQETLQILDNTIFLMFPCLNPDGQIMVTDWYSQHLETEYEGCPLPWLYHKYAGHDNNRDAFMTNLVESEYVAQTLFLDWQPQVFQDHHEMGSYGARLYVAPYCEPIHPHADPLIWREISWYGAHMAYKLEEAGITGVINAAIFPSWSHMGFHWLGNYHNIASILTESAHTNLATPLYIDQSQLQGQGGLLRGFPDYQVQTNFPHPWSGGWWRLRDIVEQQKVSALSLLDLAARHKDTILWNAYLKAKRQIERGSDSNVPTYLVPPQQHDPLTTDKLIQKLLGQGLKIYQATTEFNADGRIYPSGTYALFLNQPKMGVIKTLLGQTYFPDDARTRRSDQTPDRPYDMATDTLAEFMGVQVKSASNLDQDSSVFSRVTAATISTGEPIAPSESGYLLDGRLNDSFRAVNQLMAAGIEVARCVQSVTVEGQHLPAGSFIVNAETTESLEVVAQDTGVSFFRLELEPKYRQPIGPPRIGMYRRYRGGNMDEGWTRLVLEQFAFPYQALTDEQIEAGDLHLDLDTIILPSDSTAMILGPDEDDDPTNADTPPEYRSGIGEKGVKAVRRFVQEGGRLVALNQACDFVIDKLELKVRNLLKGKSSQQFFCPGSTLRAEVDTHHRLGYGLPTEALILAWDSPTFEILPSRFNHRYEVVVRYPDRDLLQSGWLDGEELIAGKAALISARYGAGNVILFGFCPQHRAQTHGTFKLFFNALI